MRLRVFLFIIVTMVMISQIGCFEKHQWSQKEVEQIALRAIEDYASKEGISKDTFVQSPSEIPYFDTKDKMWVLHYESRTKPIHRLIIIIDQFGNTEVHREIAKNEK